MFQGDVDIVVLPGSAGEMGILPHHAPVLAILKYGVIKIRKNGKEELFTVAGGLAEVQPDIVVIATPNIFHAPMSMAALEAGANVLCEKPLALTYADAKMVMDKAAEVGRVLTVGTHYRWSTPMRTAKAHVDAGFFGDIYAARTVWQRRAGIPGYGSWFTNKDLAGAGALYDIGVHMLDLILYVLGFPEVVAVKGFLSSDLGKQKIGLRGWGVDRGTDGRFDVDDTAFAVLTLKDGAQIRVLVTWAAFGPPEDRLTLYGTRGGLDRSGHFSSSPSLKYYTADDEGKIVESAPDLSQHVNEKAWIKAISSFVGAVRGEAPLIVLPEQALMTTRILEKINESAASGREVAI